MTYEDPIVNEVRAARERLLEEHGGYEGLLKYLKTVEEEQSKENSPQKQSQ